MLRFLAGALSCFLMITGAFLFWQGRAQDAPALPPPPPPVDIAEPVAAAPIPEPPEASPKTREEKRFSRADKDKNGRIEREELLKPRRKAFAKLDKNGNGSLSFEEWAVKTSDKFAKADADRSGFLTPAEYATTAPKRKPKKACRC